MVNEILLFDCSKGISQSALPYRRSVPTWLKLSADDVQEQIFKLAKKGLTPSQIGNLNFIHFHHQFILQSQSLTSRCHFARFARRCPSSFRDWQQSVEDFEEEGIGARVARGSLLFDQEGGGDSQAFGAQPQGPRRQIPSHSGRIAYPPIGSLLQDEARPPAHVEIRERHGFCPRRLKITWYLFLS